MNLPLISQLPQEAATALLIILLILAFVVAFKIMRMVFDTVMVSALSAGFYAVMSQLFNYSFSFNQMLTYAFLGASLYMAYSFLASAYHIAAKLVEIPYRIIKILVIPFKKGYTKIKEEFKLWKMKREKSRDDKEEDSSSTKEVVVDKLNDEE